MFIFSDAREYQRSRTGYHLIQVLLQAALPIVGIYCGKRWEQIIGKKTVVNREIGGGFT